MSSLEINQKVKSIRVEVDQIQKNPMFRVGITSQIGQTVSKLVDVLDDISQMLLEIEQGGANRG